MSLVIIEFANNLLDIASSSRLLPMLLRLGLGLAMASLVNHLANCLPDSRSVRKPICRNCSLSQSWPIFLLGRKCPHCGENRGLRFWLITLIIPILFLFPIKSATPIFSDWISLVLIPYFSIVTVVDLEHKLITSHTILFGVFAGFVTGVYQNGIIDTISGGLFGFLFFYILYLFGKFLFQKIQSNNPDRSGNDPLGFGDVKLAGVVGLMLGWPEIITGLMGAIIIGGIASLFYILYRLRTGRYQPFAEYLPYGPYLIAGTLFALIT